MRVNAGNCVNRLLIAEVSAHGELATLAEIKMLDAFGVRERSVVMRIERRSLSWADRYSGGVSEAGRVSEDHFF